MKSITTASLALALVCAAATPAAAAEWWIVTATSTEAYFVDRASVAPVAGQANTVKAVMDVRAFSAPDGPHTESAVHIDCAKTRIALKSAVKYAADGQKTDMGQAPDSDLQWLDAASPSVFWAVATLSCRASEAGNKSVLTVDGYPFQKAPGTVAAATRDVAATPRSPVR